MEMYFQVDGIKEFQDEELTCLTVGEYATYEEAKSYQMELKSKGIRDAFVIAIHNNKKISLQKARDYGN